MKLPVRILQFIAISVCGFLELVASGDVIDIVTSGGAINDVTSGLVIYVVTPGVVACVVVTSGVVVYVVTTGVVTRVAVVGVGVAAKLCRRICIVKLFRCRKNVAKSHGIAEQVHP